MWEGVGLVRQLIVLLALSVALVAASLIGFSATARAAAGCPDGFTPTPVTPASQSADKNGNLVVCFKEKRGKGGELHYTDDKI